MAKVINIEKIEAGMNLAEPVLNKHGQILLPKGAEIKDNHKRILKSWNINYITIVELEDALDYIEVSPEIYKIAEKDLKQYLTWEPKNEMEIDLYKACVTYKAKNIK